LEIRGVLYAFSTSALGGGEWSASRPGCFISGVRAPGTHRKGGWVGPRVCQDAVARRNNHIIALAGRWTPVVQPAA